MGRAKARDRGSEPLCRLVKFEATDGVELSGLLYEPRRRSTRAVVFLHGTGGGSIFDSRRTNLLAPAFVDRGMAWFPFNNRGAHIVQRLRTSRRRNLGGMGYEIIRECVADIDGAVGFLRRRGYTDITLIGHSTGANKIAVYDQRKARNAVRRYVFLAGGDDVGLIFERLGSRRFLASLARARTMIQARRGDEFVPASLGAGIMTWRSFYDMANPDGDYNVFPFLEIMRGIRLSRRGRFRHLRGVRKPSLAIYGDSDQFCFGDVPRCVAILAGEVGPNFELVIVEDADHGFGGKEKELGSLIAEWIDS